MANAAAVQDRPMTADEFWRMPDDGLRHELVFGKVRSMPPAGEHAVIAAGIIVSLGHFVRENNLGKVLSEGGFKLTSDPDTVLGPDAAFLSRERLEQVGIGKRFRAGPPDLAFEVAAPGDTRPEIEAKVRQYLQAGCRMVVVLYPNRRGATVYRSPNDVLLLTENDVLDGGDVVPGWRVPLRELFD